MNHEIAIIGMAGRFPGANDVREFYRNLHGGVDCVREISPKRHCDTNFPLGGERYHVMGLLDQIDRFDRKFFNVSPREAPQIDPHQRITMELAYETVEDAGYSPASLAGTRTAVIVANADYTYLRNFEVLEPTMYSGNSQFSVAGRISRFFDTKGPAFMVDTGCSSGLMAVTLACDQIQLGKADLALAVGVRVVLEPLPVNLDVDIGITSTDGKTRSFNADSDGSGSSEAAVSVLLKPLQRALADGDHIHAVIRATAVNSSAQSSASLTATSSAAQAELLVEAWHRAGIDPTSVAYIEAHGSGTRLGDPIEIGGMDAAFRKFTDKKHFCAVSSVKSNIGHTDKVAGLSGLVKAVLSLQRAELFPSLHFDRPNPLIDFANSATYINTTLKPWLRPNGTPRRAGVNSFGFAGNNVHVVLEEPPPRNAPPPRASESRLGALHLVTFSSKRPAGVAENRAALLRHLEQASSVDVADISFTLNAGRAHFRHRDAFLVRSTSDLIAQLRAAPTDASQEARDSVEPLFVFSGDAPLDERLIRRLAGEFPVFAQRHADCLAVLAEGDVTESVRRFAFHHALYDLLASLGVNPANIVGTGSGDLVVQTITGDLSLAEAVRASAGLPARAEPDLPRRLATLSELGTATKPAVFIEMGTTGCLSAGLRRLGPAARDNPFDVLTLDPEADDSILDLLRRFYLAGGTVDWTAAHRHYAGRRISLPGYQFEKIRCWYREPHSSEAYAQWRRRLADGTSATAAGPAVPAPAPRAEMVLRPVDPSWTDTEQKVARIWMEVLKIEHVGLSDDFFALGGHSLFGTMVRNRIEKAFRLRLEFRDIFVCNTVRSLAQNLDCRLASGIRGLPEDTIPALSPAEHYVASPAQRLLWRIEQNAGAANSAYNVPVVLRLTGPLDTERLELAVREVIARHEALRTHLVEIAGEPRQVVAEATDFRLDQRSAATPDEALAIIDGFIRPFELSRPPLVRGLLIRANEGSHVLALDIHHAFFDGTSLGVLLRELSVLYGGGQPAPLSRSYKDYAAWRVASLAQPASREAEAFWLNQFSGPVPVLALPTDFPRPAGRSYEGALFQTTFDAGLAMQLRHLGQRENATVFMVLLAAYSVLLSKVAGQEDIVVGSSVAGRTHADLEPLIGMFVNTLAFRNRPEPALTFREFLAQVRDHCLQVYRFQSYPLETLERKLDLPRDPSRGGLFDTMLVLQNMDLGSATFAEGLELSAVEYSRKSAKFDLTFEFYDEGQAGLALNLEYATTLFRPETIRALADALRQVMTAVCADPDVRLKDLVDDRKTVLAVV